MHEVLAQWSTTGIAIAIYVVVTCLHLNQVRVGLRRGSPSERTGRPRGQLADAALFQAGLLTAVLALMYPVSYWSGRYIWVRASQDLLLCFAAPVLISLGIRRWRPGGLAHPAELDVVPPVTAWSRVSPVAAAVAFNLACLVWHVPRFFDAVQANAVAQFSEYAIYLGTGTWFWLQIFRPHPGPWRSPLRRLGLLTATLVAWTVLGMVLVFGSNVMYPAYVNSLHHALTVLDDQQLSGGVLWMGMMPVLITAGVILLTAWLNDEDRDSPADAEVPIRNRAWGWSTRSGLR